MSEKPKARDIFEKVESDVTSLRWDIERANAIAEAIKAYEEEGNTTKATEMRWEGLLFNLRYLQNLDERKKSKTRFAPMVEYTNGAVFPDVRSFTNQQIEYYRARANETSNPIHKARYNDIVWEMQRDHVFARNAIIAYLKCVPIFYENKWEMEMVDSMLRAAELALTLNDQEAIETVREALVEWLKKLSEGKNFRWCLELIDGILEIKRFLKNDELEICVGIAKSAASFYEKVNDGYHLQQSFLEKLVLLMNALKRPDEAIKYLEAIAESCVNEGTWKLEHYPSGDLVAAFFYERAAKLYRDLGRREKSDELIKKVKEHTMKSEKDMKTIKVEFTVTNEQIQKYIQTISSLSLAEALKKISNDNSFVPNVQLIKSTLEKQKGKSLALVFPIVSIRDGNPALHSQTEDEIFEDNVVSSFSLEYKLRISLLGIIFDELVKTKNLNHETLLSYLLSSKVYESNSEKMLKVGFERYFSGDYISYIHILTPQLERTFRHTLARLGVATTFISGDEIEEKTLGSILREKKLQALLGDDISFCASTLLVDKRGDNLRNDISHGLITETSCDRNTANSLLHIFLLLTRFNI
jgi:tetratricopeptide (TPR) repeat protein